MTLTQITKIRGAGIHTTSNIVSHNIDSSGIITAVAFKGPFTGSSNIQSGIVTATKIDLNGDIDVDGHTNLDNVNVAGVATFASAVNTGALTATTGTFSGNVSIGGTLTYEDVTNIDSVGIITARDGLKILAGGANVVGVVTATTFKGNGDFVELDVDGHTNLDNVSISGFTTITQDLDVDGHTNLDNVSVVGVTTFTKVGATAVFNSGAASDGRLDFQYNNSRVGLLAYHSDRLEIQTDSSKDFTIRTGGANARLRIKSTGQVTIGAIAATSSASGILHTRVSNTTSPVVFENDTENADVVIRTTGTNKHSILGFGDGGDNFAGNIDYDHQNNAMVFDTNGGERLNISSSGVITQVETGTGNGQGGIKASTASAGGNAGFGFITGGTQRFSVVTIGSAGSEALRVYDVNNSSERLRIDPNGYLLVGHDTRDANIAHGTAGKVQLWGTSWANAGIALVNTQASTDPAFLSFAKSRKANGNASPTAVQSGDRLGEIRFAGDDGTDMHSFGASIAAYAEGTIAGNRMPGKLVFATTSDTAGAVNSSTRLVIDQSGHIIPGDAGTQDLGSPSKEYRHLYLGDSGMVKFGLDQDMTMTFDSSNASIELSTGSLSIINYANNEDVKILSDNGSGGVANYFVADGSTGEVLLHHYGSQKFATSTTGISVTGEVAATQDYPTIRPTLDLNFAATKTLDPRITYSRTGSASYINEFGKVVLVGANTPRFDHDPITRESKGLLIEEERTNFMKYSDEFAIDHGQTGGNWDAIGGEDKWTRVSDTTETKDPAGTYHASKLTHNSGNVLRGYWYSGAADGAVSKTFSVYLKRATTDATTVTIDIGDTSSTAMTLTDEWKRYSVTTSTAGSGNFVDFSATNTKAFYAWGCQIEAGGFATSYIPTSTAAVIRGKDLAEIDGEEFTDFFNQTEGTINCAYWLGNDSVGLRVFQINDSNNSVIDIVAGSGSGSGGYGYVNTGGVAQANGGSSSANAGNLNTLHVTTLAYKENDVAGINIKNGTLTNDTSATLDGAYNRVTFYQGANGADQLNGHLKRVQYYPKRLPDNQLKNLNNQ